MVQLTNRTPHRSTPNRSDVIRWSIDIRYQSADLPTNFPPLAMDRNGSASCNGADSADASLPEAALTCYPPESDYLVRSRSRPEAVVRTWREFNEIRRGHVPADSTVRWE